MDETRKLIGENIKKAAMLRGIKQVEIAKYLGVSQGSVSNWIKGTNSIDLELLAKLASFLGVSLDQIFGYEKMDETIVLTEQEINTIRYYRQLDDRGRNLVDTIVAELWLYVKGQKEKVPAVRCEDFP